MGFDLAGLGRWSEERDFKVEPAQTVAYALATNDANPRYVEARMAPPIFAVVPVWDGLYEAVARLTPSEVLMRVVHGEQDIRFLRPIVPGEVLRSRVAPIGLGVKGSGTTLVAKAETRDGAGALVNEQWFTSFFRGVSEGDSGGEAPPDHRLGDEVKASGPIAMVTYPVDEDQTFRYAEASGDRMPIHTDESFARAVGLPGIILHGLCTMAFAGRAVVECACGGDPARLRRLAVRFSRPVLPGQAISTTLYGHGPGMGAPEPGLRRYGFEVTNPEGQLVVKDGLAEVAS